MPNPQHLLFTAPDLNEIDPATLTLLTPPTRAAFGRRLYQYRDGQGHTYVLKTQLQDGHADVAASFQRELEFYQDLGQKQADFLLPYYILQTTPNEMWGQHIFVLPQAKSFLTEPEAQQSIDACLHAIWQMVNVLDALHQYDWIHADLKAAHFVQYQNKLCLLDFEQAMQLNVADHEVCQNALVTATPRYMAPELFHGEPKTVQSDLYALGIILLEWLTGQRLYAKSYQDWAVLHCQQLKVELPSHQNVFKALLEGLLAKQKSARFSDLTAVKRYLMTEIE